MTYNGYIFVKDKRPQPKRRKSTGAEVSHGSGRKSSTSAPRPMPLSERQQLALLMQMTAAESQHNTGESTKYLSVIFYY